MKLGPIKNWSHSRLVDFESCRFKAFLKIVEKIPDTGSKTAADRGTRVHNECEAYVKGEGPMPAEAAKDFIDEMEALKKLYTEGKVSLEGEWGFDQEWNPVPYKSAWLKVKADGVAHLTPKMSAVIDYKTGKRFGNEVKHGEQLLLYSIAVLKREPEVQTIAAELWYLDIRDLARTIVSRDKMERIVKRFHMRGERMTTCTDFPADPNVFSCKWCPYKPVKLGGSGHCKVGV